MAETISADRRPVLADHAGGQALVSIAPAAPCLRVALRAPQDSVAAVSDALGLILPTRPKTSASKAGRTALWLGPDEWLVLDEDDRDMLAPLGAVSAFHAAVDVSHRNVGILVSGPAAAAVLNAGCPQDLSLAVFPVGACSRTVLGKIEIVLWRSAAETFRVECWRSFADYALTFLLDAARDASA